MEGFLSVSFHGWKTRFARIYQETAAFTFNYRTPPKRSRLIALQKGLQMREMIFQTGLHLGSRIASVGLSFLLFGWIGRVLTSPEAVEAYFFSFSLGFGLATSRTCLFLGAAVDGKTRVTQRVRDAVRGLQIQRRLLPYLAIAMGAAAWIQTSDIPIVVATSLIVILAAPDIDLLRAVIGRPSIFSLTFASGSILALVLLQWWLPHTLHGVAWALLAQWLPVSLLNTPALRRSWRCKNKIPDRVQIIAVLALASFDGLVLNAPFLGWLHLTTRNSLDLALAMRVFLATLPMLPLLLHWTHFPAFHELCERVGLRQESGLVLGLFVSGLICGATFLFIYRGVANQAVGFHIVLLSLLLLLAYSLYASRMRFASAGLTPRERLYKVSGATVVFLILLPIVVDWDLWWSIILLQVLILLGASWSLTRTPSSGEKS